jgi:hypothetical protein
VAANSWESFIASWEKPLRDAFLDGVDRIRDAAEIGLIAERLEKGDVEGALRAVGIDASRFRELDARLAEAFAAGGRFTEGRIPATRDPNGYRLDILFDVRNPRAEAWLRQHSANLIRQIADDQRTMVRAVLTQGLVDGRNPRDVALEIAGRINRATGRRDGGLIGLTATQQEWARSYARELATGNPAALQRALRDRRFDARVRRAIREGRGLTKEEALPVFRAYLNRALRWRAETIARTEAMTALHQSSQEAMQQAIDAGQVDEAAVTKVWHSAGDKRVRDTHQALDGQEVAFRADFVSPSGARLRFPGDPSAPPAETINCRCWADYSIDFLRGIQ